MNRIILIITLIVCLGVLGCQGQKNFEEKVPVVTDSNDNRVVIYSSAESYRNEYFVKKLKEQFPQYEIVYEYLPTGEHAAKLKAEGLNTECDITLDLEYGYMEMLKDNFAVLDNYDSGIYTSDIISKDKKYLPENKQGGAIIINNRVLQRKNVALPKSYDDLLKPEYKNLIVMPNPRLSGTGYIFVKSLVNAMGEEEAFSYFDQLNENILYYTPSGSGPVNALLMEEAGIGLGLTAQAVFSINNGADFTILFFEEGSPFTCYGTAIIKGKEQRAEVQKVFRYINEVLIDDNNRMFFPEQIYVHKTYKMKNYPENIKYADMRNNVIEEKLRLLEKWRN